MHATRYRYSTTNGNGQITVSAAEHFRAIQCPTPAAKAFLDMLRGWELYAEAYLDRYGDNLGHDYVLGVAWAEAGLAIKRLLDGEAGGLDCGSLAANITDTIQANGISTDGYCLTGIEDNN